MLFKNSYFREFPGSPVVWLGVGLSLLWAWSIPGRGTKIPQATRHSPPK